MPYLFILSLYLLSEAVCWPLLNIVENVYSKKLNFKDILKLYIKGYKKSYKDKNLIIQLIFVEVVSVLITISGYEIFFNNVGYSITIKIIEFFFILSIILILGYLSLYDYFFLEVSNIPSIILIAISIMFNVFTYFYSGNLFVLWRGNSFYAISNFFASAIAALFIIVLYFATKKKGIGDGDIRLAIVMGLLLGTEKLVYGFYVTVFSATVIGLLYSFKIKKFKGIVIPLVPFLALGILIPLILVSLLY